MGEHEPQGVEQGTVIRRVARTATLRRSNDDVLAAFLPPTTTSFPSSMSTTRREEDLYAVALTHLDWAAPGPEAKPSSRFCGPITDRDGWHSDRSVVLMITDDAPFLVDTARIVLERNGIATHLLVHPMLSVRAIRPATSWPSMSGPNGTASRSRRGPRSRSTAVMPNVPSGCAKRSRRRHRQGVHLVVADFAAIAKRMLAYTQLDPMLDWSARGTSFFSGRPPMSWVPMVRSGTDSQLGVLTGDCEIDPDIDLEGPVVAVAGSSSNVDDPSQHPAHGHHGAATRRERTIDRASLRRLARFDRIPAERAGDPVGRRPEPDRSSGWPRPAPRRTRVARCAMC